LWRASSRRPCRSKSQPGELRFYGRGFAVEAAHLPLPDHVRCLDAGNENACTAKELESEYRSNDALDRLVVLFDDVV
jgi:hypothetical protein